MIRAGFLLLFLLPLAVSCRIDYDLAGGEDDASLPDIYMEGVEQIQKEEGSSLFYLNARTASLFNKEEETLFTGLEFREKDREGEDKLLVTVGRAKLYGNNDADLSGGVNLESYRDNVKISGSDFNWNDSDTVLTSPEGSEILLVREGESEIWGSGFRADFNLNEISFDSSVKGVLTVDD